MGLLEDARAASGRPARCTVGVLLRHLDVVAPEEAAGLRTALDDPMVQGVAIERAVEENRDADWPTLGVGSVTRHRGRKCKCG